MEDANVAFVAKLAKEIASPFGPMVAVYVSSSASNSLLAKVRSKVKNAYSLKDEGIQGNFGKDGVCILLTPSSQKDYRVARELAESGCKTVIVNGLFKVSACLCSRFAILVFISQKWHIVCSISTK